MRVASVLILLLLPAVSGIVLTSIEPGTEKIRPWDDLSPQESITIHAVRGQWANFQVITRVEGTEEVTLTVSATTPTRGDEQLWEPDIYRLQSISVVQPSMHAIDTGEWPDALIPEEDRYFHEDRNAYPFTLRNTGPAYAYHASTNKHFPDLAYASNTAEHAPLTHGTYTGEEPRKYWIEVTTGGAAGEARFAYSTNEGASWQGDTIIPADPDTVVPLEEGIRLSFPVQPGGEYDTGDRWELFAAPYRNEATYIEIFVPENTSAGAYTGTVTATAGDDKFNHSYTIVVHDITIPRTSSVHTAFWGDMSLITSMVTGESGDYRDEQRRPLWNQYIEEGLFHRITTTDMLPWMDWDGAELSGTGEWSEVARRYLDGDWSYGARFTQLMLPQVNPQTSYSNIIRIRKIWNPFISDYDVSITNKAGDFINGEHVHIGNQTANCNNEPYCREIANTTRPPLPGESLIGLASNATASISTNPNSEVLPSDSFLLPHLYNLLVDQGFFGQTINLLADEPWWEDMHNNPDPPPEYTEVFHRTHDQLEAVMPGLKQMIIHRFTEEWQDVADIWVPHAGQCPVGSRDRFGCNITNRGDQLERDMDYWMYVVGTHPDHLDRFAYIADTPYEHVRGIGWLMHVGDIQGLLHYKIAKCIGVNKSASWENIYYNPYGNDNCIIYPGYAEKIGGTTDIPVASWRLKQLRQGLEELEVLLYASENGHSEYTHEKAMETVGTYWSVYEILPTTESLTAAYEDVLNTVAPYTPTCGDGVCELDETEVSCAVDCTSGPPNIDSTSGDIKHGGTITIHGTGFGEKSPAAPLIWDDFESGTEGEMLQGWLLDASSGRSPTYAADLRYGQGTLSGMSDMTDSQYLSAAYQNLNADEFYVSVRINEQHLSGPKSRNIKYPRVTSTERDARSGDTLAGYTRLGETGIFYTGNNNDGDLDSVWTSIPTGTWMRYELYSRLGDKGVANGARGFWINGQEIANDPAWATYGSQAGREYETFSLPFYVAHDEGGDYRIYYDNVYVDSTRARVEICESPTWSVDTEDEERCAVQLPTAWSNSAVTVTLQQGEFPTGTQLYLYVVDSNGAVNEEGHPLTFAQSCTDADGDGYDSPFAQCTPLGDCDDSNDAVYPGAEERCNGLDDNCNGDIDENCPVCGNGVVENGEECEPDTLDGESCTSLGYDSGALGCSASCSYDTSGCATCDDGVQNGDETDIDCGGSCPECTSSDSCSDIPPVELGGRPCIEVTDCGPLEETAYYLLTQDISAPGTCINIQGTDITLDLQGHTIRYGGDNQDDRHGIENRGTGTVVRNGIIIQDGRPAANLNGQSGIHWASTTGLIEFINSTAAGHDSFALEVAGWSEPCPNTGTLTIRNNTLANTGTSVSSRDGFTSGVLRLTRPNSRVDILGNTITASPQTGIVWTDIDWTLPGRQGRRGCGDGSVIADNTITINDAQYANPSGIICYQCPALNIHHNLLNGQGMEGIQLDNAFNQNGQTRTLIHHNIIDIDGNYHSKGHSAGTGEIQGIRLRYRPEYIDVYENTIRINADNAADNEQNHAYGIWFTGAESGYATDVDFWNNEVTVSTDGATNVQAEALHIDAVNRAEISGISFYNNTFESNHRLFAMGYNGPWTQDYSKTLVQNNTFRKANAATYDFATTALYYSGWGDSILKNIDPLFENGASKTDIDFLSYSGNDIGALIYFTAVPTVRTLAGVPVTGATVTARDSFGATQGSCSTSADGSCRMILPDYRRTRVTGATSYNPYTFTASKDGKTNTTSQNIDTPHEPVMIILALDLTPSCGDATCNNGETCSSCPADCGACPTCDDGVQNQGETGVDCGGSCPACAGNETNVTVACSDGIDNDGDFLVDYSADPGCADGNDMSELGSNECDNGLDDDGDGDVDLTDVACADAYGAAELVCGDGIQEPAEECDDNNTVSEDGCNAFCELEYCGDGIQQDGLGEECDGGIGCSDECLVEYCGDAITQTEIGEECDDGNNEPGDGCHACTLESCGDGVQQEPEECDDGNNESGDGCSAICVHEYCGDRIVQPQLNETCESTNDTCEMYGFLGGTLSCTDCQIDTSGCFNITCDDGVQNGDETGVDCGGACGPCISPTAQCGNNLTEDGEECDGAFNETCVSLGYTGGNLSCADCAFNTSNCTGSVCGNAILDDGEACDDGNTAGGDGCETDCTETPTPNDGGGSAGRSGGGGSGGSSGGGSSGGGSGASLSPAPSVSERGEFTLNRWGRQRHFIDRLDQEHTVRIKSIGDTTVVFIIESDPVEVELRTGQAKNVDVNGDMEADLRLRLISFSDYSAKYQVTEPQLTIAPIRTSEAADQPTSPPVVLPSPPTPPEPAPAEIATEVAEAAPESGAWLVILISTLSLLLAGGFGGLGYWFYRHRKTHNKALQDIETLHQQGVAYEAMRPELRQRGWTEAQLNRALQPTRQPQRPLLLAICFLCLAVSMMVGNLSVEHTLTGAAPTLACTDPDGLDTNVAGTAKGELYTGTWEQRRDACTTHGLQEWYCHDGGLSVAYVDCACDAGRCINNKNH